MASEPAKPVVKPLPHSWLPTALGLGAACIALIGSVAVVAEYMGARPLDLRDASLRAAESIHTGLVSNRIQENSIRGGTELRTSAAAELHYFEYEADVPAAVDPEGLQTVLRRQLQKLGVSVRAFKSNGREPTLEISLAKQLLGYVRLIPSEQEAWREWPAVDEADDAPADAGESVTLDVEPPPAESDTPVADTTLLSMLAPEEAILVSAPQPDGRLRVAIILDDGGYGGEITERVLAMDPRLTLSILPYTPSAKTTAERAAQLGFEVMLHMPMENTEENLKYEGQLEAGMPAEQIEALTKVALLFVPGAVGINNHTGSKYTADAVAMEMFFNAIRDTGLFFIDSRTTAESQAYDQAIAAGIPANDRDVFLDHENDPEIIRAQFDSTIELAKARGEAIAIGHFREATVSILEEALPRLEASGIDLVHASELVR